MEPVSSNYHFGRRCMDARKMAPGRLWSFLRLPGAVQPLDFPDPVTGDRVQIRSDRFFTTISVNNRDYYFRRVTGQFDGTGYQFRNPNQEPFDCILADIPISVDALSVWGRLKLLLPSIG